MRRIVLTILGLVLPYVYFDSFGWDMGGTSFDADIVFWVGGRAFLIVFGIASVSAYELYKKYWRK